MTGPQPACAVADLPGTGAKRVLLTGPQGQVAVAVVRDEDGDLHAIGDTCTHAEVSLSEGEVEDCAIECWLHGSQFDLRTGKPMSLPATVPVPVFPLTVVDEQILVDVSQTSMES